MRNFNSYEFKCSFMLLTLFFLFVGVLSQNTHQNITFNVPEISPFRVFLKPNDKVVASIYNTNARYLIAFLSEDRETLLTEEGHCFKPEVCKLEFESKWNVIGWVLYQIYYSHEYDYEIKVNDNILKSEHIDTLISAETFIYPYLLEPKTYSLTFYYQSDLVKSLTFTIFDKDYLIKANRKRTININVTELTPNYSFYFELPDMDLEVLPQNLNIPVTVLVPNDMLKNCNGFNSFNKSIKACGELIEKETDTLVIERYGIPSHFTLHRKQSVTIRITLVELIHFFDELDVPKLTSFLIQDIDPSIFRERPVQWVLDHFKSQYQQCEMVGDQCEFKYLLGAGRYAFLPFLPSHLPEFEFVYLFERLNDKDQAIESYFSVFPVQIDTNYEDEAQFIFNGFMLEFTPTTDELTQIEIQSEHEIAVEAYSINKKNEIDENEEKSVFELIEMGLENAFAPDMTKISIITDLEPNKPHIFYLKFHSREFFVEHMEEGNDKYEIFSTDPKLENTSITIKLTNGRFPHPKIEEKIIEGEDNDMEIDREKIDHIDDELPLNLLIVFIGLMLIIIGLIAGLIVLMIKNNRKKKALSEMESNKSLLSDNSIIANSEQVNLSIQKNQQLKDGKPQNQSVSESVDQKIVYTPYNDELSSKKENKQKIEVSIEMSEAIITESK